MKTFYLRAASLVALGWAGAANAQVSTTAAASRSSTDQSSPSAPAIAANTPVQALDAPDAPIDGEIIVTAQRRSERLVDVPASVSTVSGAELQVAGSDSLLSLNKLVSGVYFNRPTYNFSPTIRGIGSTLTTSQEANVATYVDGVYQATQSSNLFDLASISDIEVLKGPQGTLFGRNATGGAILVKTLDPTFQTVGRFNISYGRFNDLKASAYVNVPVSDLIAINGSVSYRYSDGYLRDLRTGANVQQLRSLAARAKLLFQPTNSLKVILTAAHNELDDPTGAQSQLILTSYSTVPAAQPIASGRFDVSHNAKDVIKTDSDEYSAHVALDTRFGALTSITALKRDVLSTTTDVDNTYAPAFRVDFTFRTNSFSQEINLTSDADKKLSYVLGLYYFDFKAGFPQYDVNGVRFLFLDRTNKALAGYADGTLRLGKLSLIAGLRYSTEKREQTNGLLVPTRVGTSISARDSGWTPRVGLRYALTDRSNVCPPSAPMAQI